MNGSADGRRRDCATARLDAIVVQPTFAYMRSRPSRWLAFGVGAGLSPYAPGTVGTMLAWISFVGAAALVPWQVLAAVTVAALVASVWAIGRVTLDLGVVDHSAIVCDEIVAFWLVLLLVPGTFTAQLIAFLLFRLFDIWKPWPIRQVDKHWHSPFGVMLDDLLAAAAVVLIFVMWGGGDG